ncbi:protein kinase [Anabaena sp. PCC 7108]|uniref:serine/threonine protein kinase n=1 Tax=Anabaena sp. PCC 7108 TaxID=163908 RepID=UPI000344AC12
MENILANRYIIQKQLGKKAGRRTLLAKDLKTEELVIVKLLSFGSDFQWDDLKLFERKAETLKSLSHPCIPRYLDYFEINSSTFKGFALIQAYIPAKTLEQYLQSGRKFTELEVKQIGKSILKILVYLHGLNPPVIHRDIKPSNILLRDRTGNNVGEVYLIDFGSVQTVLATEKIGTRTIVGTYGYMPQEQFGGRTVPASDLYSLGATLIYLVTGSHPADLPEKDFRIQFEEVANLSENFSNWLKLMTEPSLGNRLRSVNEAITALDQPQLLKNAALTFKKPTDSKIKLTKNKELIEIIIPPIGLRMPSFNALFSTVFLVSISQSIVLVLQELIVVSPFFKMIEIIFFILILSLLYKLLFILFGRMKLQINQHQISLIHELWGTKIKFSKPALKEDICLLQRIRKYAHRNSGLTALQIQAQIIIWAGKRKKFTIGNDNDLISEPELDWLAHELSEWLDMPIRTE